MTEQNIAIKNKSYVAPMLFIMAGLLAVIIWMAKCGGNRSIDQKLAKLEKKIVDDSIRETSAKKLLQDSLKDTRGELELAKLQTMEARQGVELLGKAVIDLLNKHQKSEPPKPIDSGKYSVTGEWIKDCADCFSLLEQGKDSVKLLLTAIDKKDSLKNVETLILERTIDTLKFYSDKKDKRISEVIDFAKKASKPKVSVAIGIEAMYSPAVSNFGGWLQLKDKRGRIYGVDGGINTLQKTYFGMKAGFTLFGNR